MKRVTSGAAVEDFVTSSAKVCDVVEIVDDDDADVEPVAVVAVVLSCSFPERILTSLLLASLPLMASLFLIFLKTGAQPTVGGTLPSTLPFSSTPLLEEVECNPSEALVADGTTSESRLVACPTAKL